MNRIASTTLLALAFLLVPSALAQTTASPDPPADDRAAVRAAVLDYVEAIYLVDSTRIARSVSPDLVKIGWYRTREGYQSATMTFRQLESLATTWNASGERADETSPKRITVLDLLDRTAVARLDAAWGIDYFHLAKEAGRWQILHVLWQTYPPPTFAETDTGSDTLRAADVIEENGFARLRSTGEPANGSIVESHPDGSRKMRRSVVGGRAEGLWMEWHPNGVPSYIGTWKNGRGDGVWTYFHDNGEVRERSHVTDDVWHGPTVSRAADGTLRTTGTYWFGERHGIWRFWDEAGALDRTERYYRGRLLEGPPNGSQ